jgi:hypothetical protein
MNVAKPYKLWCIKCQAAVSHHCACAHDTYIVYRCRRLKMNGVHCWHYNGDNVMACCDCGELMSNDL